jgi:hypothetical protein
MWPGTGTIGMGLLGALVWHSMVLCPMEVGEIIQCPFCGQSFDLVIDTSIPTQKFTTDCEVCCRPLEVSVECELGEVLSLDVQEA